MVYLLRDSSADNEVVAVVTSDRSAYELQVTIDNLKSLYPEEYDSEMLVKAFGDDAKITWLNQNWQDMDLYW